MIESVIPRLVQEVRTALFFARKALSQHGGRSLESEHLLLGLLEVRPEAVVRFTTPDWTAERIADRLIAAMTTSDGTRVPEGDSVDCGMSLVHLLEQAAAEADRLETNEIRSEHIVLAFIGDQRIAGEVVREAGVNREKLLMYICQQ
jgi:ATP-dependent Clp protease ATP-binding subunit ClpA